MDSIAVAATVLAAVFLVPQIARLSNLGDTRGVSATWAGFGLITNLAWVAYLWQQEMWLPSIAPGIAFVTYGITVAVLARLDRARRWTRASLLFAAVVALTGSVGGVVALGLVLVLTPLIQVAPELAAVFRERHPVGVSPATWAIGVAEAVLWGIYGWRAGDTALLGYGIVTATASLLILGRWVATRPHGITDPKARLVVRLAPGTWVSIRPSR